MVCGSAYESLRYRLHWRLTNTSWNFRSRCLKSSNLPHLPILFCLMTFQRWIFSKADPFDARRTQLFMSNTCSLPVVRWDRAKMATGKMSFNYYQNGKYGSLPQNPQKDMEVTQDMHLKMSKKIAQLTKVSWVLFFLAKLIVKNQVNHSIYHVYVLSGTSDLPRTYSTLGCFVSLEGIWNFRGDFGIMAIAKLDLMYICWLFFIALGVLTARHRKWSWHWYIRWWETHAVHNEMSLGDMMQICSIPALDT